MFAASINSYLMTTQRRRIVWVIAIASPLIVLIAYSAYWMIAAAWLKSWIADWQHEQRNAGLLVNHSGLHIDGFPGAFRITLQAPRAEQRTSIRSWSWSSQQLEARTGPFDFRRVRGEIYGDHMMVYQDSSMSSRLRAAAESTTFSINSKTRHESAALSFRNTTIGSDLLAGDLVLQGGDVMLALRPGAEGRPDVMIDVDAVGLQLPQAALSAHIPQLVERLGLRAVWLGPIPTARSYPAFAAWRDDGGTIEIPRAFVKFDDIALSADGTAALDGAMRPLAAFKARIQGFESALTRLTSLQDLSPIESAAARIALRLMAKRSEQSDSVEFALTIQDGRIYVGKVPIAHVRPIFAVP